MIIQQDILAFLGQSARLWGKFSIKKEQNSNAAGEMTS